VEKASSHIGIIQSMLICHICLQVLYPELESHPQHKIHKKQTTGMSGMISFYIRGGMEESQQFLANLKVQEKLYKINFTLKIYPLQFTDFPSGRIPWRL
jgi:cystathionine beta-lyase/cystathionine gamma-synthase